MGPPAGAGIRGLRRRLLALAGAMLASAAPAEPSRVVNVDSWADYLPPRILRKFEGETGIKVCCAVTDSSDVMETTLLAGHSGFDPVRR